MYIMRRWSTRNAAFLEWTYYLLEGFFLKWHPLLSFIGYQRIEHPVRWIEKPVKSFLFDCQMCGRCVLTATGMTCPMLCPKERRNGPCGGVRANGNCEIKAGMPCVWVEAAKGAGEMKRGGEIRTVQVAVDHSLKGSSSWLRVLQQKNQAPESA